jgi:hypothetical protein
VIFWHRKRLRKLDQQVQLATDEKKLSEERLEAVRAKVVAPRDAAIAHNKFAETLAKSLELGWGREK